MKRLKLPVIIIIAIAFFLTVRLNTKGYIIPPPELIDTDRLDMMVEQMEAQIESNDIEMDKDMQIYHLFNRMLHEAAIEEEALRLGITVTEEEINKHIDQQRQFFEEMLDDEGENGFKSFLEDTEMTLDEYLWEYTYDQMKYQVLMGKFYEELAKKNSNDYDNINDTMIQIYKDFTRKHQDQIKRLKERYNISHLDEEHPIF